jgi:mono/diheme cytochrome c family protein
VLVAVAAAMVAVAACSNGPANCSTGQASYREEGRDMSPGGNCIECHKNTEAPVYFIAGTVMGAHDDDEDCSGISGATVRITGADGSVVDLSTSAVGNFYTRHSVALPYTAKVLKDGKERPMAAAQTDGNCANCHTAGGANGAPGRILAP